MWMSIDPISNYDPRNNENYLDGEHNGGVLNYLNLNPYIYCYQSPVKLKDPNGKQVIAVHGTWSSNKTWQNQSGINRYTRKTFGNKSFNYSFNWSGGNYTSMRTTAAKNLVQKALELRSSLPKNEPLTIVGHSHGGNVGIEAINLMVTMPEFKDVKINLLTINTPVRNDYQLSKEAQQRVTHINVYDPSDPVQIKGGNSFRVLPDNPSTIKGTGEYGQAGRMFKNAKNIRVNNPQGFIDHWEGARNVMYPVFGDFHNSHNRVKDWENK